MLNKKNIACLIFVFLSLKIYAEDDFNVISQCTDEYEMVMKKIFSYVI